MKKILLTILFLICLVSFSLIAYSQEILDIKQHIELKKLGNAYIVADFKCSPEMYKAIKERFPTPDLFIKRFLTPDKFEAEPRNIKAIYNDDFFKIHVEMDVLGIARNHGRYWTLEIGEEQEIVNQIKVDNDKAVFESVESDLELTQRIETIVTLPEKSTDVQFDTDTKLLRYSLSLNNYKADHVDIKCITRQKSNLMTSIYKLYGSSDFPNLWIAKALFTNTGNTPLKDFQIKFSLGGYSDGYSETYETPLFLPKQSIVEVYRPILSSKCTSIKSPTPVKLKINYSYTLPDNTRKEKEIIKRINLLGYRDFVFSGLRKEEIISFADMFDNADYITAWVTSDDPIVCEFGGMANELARGAGGAVDDEQAAIVSAAIYELMRHNKITYQSPTGLFNADNIQHLKYPRNTLRDKSATCIDLAIAFAAFAEAQGLNPILVLIPGHCFPAVILPKSGNILAIEMTLLGGGTKDSSQGFEKAVEVGTKELEEAISKGNIIFINTGELKRKGVIPPELERLPPDILQKWDIKKLVASQDNKSEKTTAKTSSSDWVNWVHPNKHFAINCPSEFTYQQPDEYTVNFISPEENFMAQIIIIPKKLQGQVIGEEQMANIFITSKGTLIKDKSNVSDPKPVTLGDNIPALSREYFLSFDNDVKMFSYSLYFDAGDLNFLIAGCFITENSVDKYDDTFKQMINSVQFGHKIYKSGESAHYNQNSQDQSQEKQEQSLEDSFKELGQAFDELLNSLK